MFVFTYSGYRFKGKIKSYHKILFGLCGFLFIAMKKHALVCTVHVCVYVSRSTSSCWYLLTPNPYLSFITVLHQLKTFFARLTSWLCAVLACSAAFSPFELNAWHSQDKEMCHMNRQIKKNKKKEKEINRERHWSKNNIIFVKLFAYNLLNCVTFLSNICQVENRLDVTFLSSRPFRMGLCAALTRLDFIGVFWSLVRLKWNLMQIALLCLL